MGRNNANPAQVPGYATRLERFFRSALVAFPLGLPHFSTILCTLGSLSSTFAWRPRAVLAAIPFFLHFGWYLTARVARGKFAASTAPRRVVITSLTFYAVFTSWLKLVA